MAVQESHAVSQENLGRRGTMRMLCMYLLGRFKAAFTASQHTLGTRFLTVVSAIS
jgi:hypothetical protein